MYKYEILWQLNKVLRHKSCIFMREKSCALSVFCIMNIFEIFLEKFIKLLTLYQKVPTKHYKILKPHKVSNNNLIRFVGYRPSSPTLKYGNKLWVGLFSVFGYHSWKCCIYDWLLQCSFCYILIFCWFVTVPYRSFSLFHYTCVTKTFSILPSPR